MNKKYIVRLTDEERAICEATIKQETGKSQKLRRATTLLKADADGPAWADEKISEAVGCRTRTVENVRQAFVLEGFESALARKQRATPPTPKLLDGAGEAKLIAMRLGKFLFFEPLRGWRRVWVTQQRRKLDWAECVKELLEIHYSQASKIVLVCDNLNTHTGGALYEKFAPAEAKRLCERLEFHPTPKHGSWLNMAETELSVLAGQCLDRRMDNQDFVVSEVAAWEAERNGREAKVRWRFTTEDARIKLEKLYPVLEYPTLTEPAKT